MRKSVLVIISTLIGTAAAGWVIDAQATTVRIAAPIVAPPWSGAKFIEESVDYLRWKLPGDQFDLTWEEPAKIGKLLQSGQADIGIVPSGVLNPTETETARLISTMASRRTPLPDRSSSCVFVVRKDSTAHSLKDLQGLSAGAGDPNAIDGMLACLGEIEKNAGASDRFFSRIQIFGPLGDRKTLRALKKNSIDVAMIRSGYAEDVLEASGRDILEDFRVIGRKQGELLDVHSATAYPGPSVMASSSLDPALVHAILATLLNKPLNGWGQYWTVPAAGDSIDELSRSLKIGPYAYLKTWTLKRIWTEYRLPIIVLLIMVLGLILHGWRSEVLVRRHR